MAPTLTPSPAPVAGPAGEPNASRAVPSAPRAALAGAIAGAVALAVGELLTAIAGSGPSLVTAVGGEFIDRFAASLKDLAVTIFGTNDKPALVVGIVAISIGIGALLGRGARHRRWLPWVGFAVFGLLGWWVYANDPQGSTGLGFVAAAGAALAGVGTFEVLWRLALPAGTAADVGPSAPRTSVTGPPTSRASASAPATAPVTVGRRRFVIGVAGFVGGAAAAAVIGRRIRSADSIEATRRQTVLPRPVERTPVPSSQPFAVDGLSPYVTPTGDFYRIDTALSTPQVDAASWELRVTGMVDAPFSLTYDELLSMEAIEVPVTLQCVSNEVGGDLVGTAVWQGVPLAAVLARARVQPGATQIVGRSIDGWTAGFPTDVALDGRTALVAYAMNGEALPAAHGYPARLVVAGLYGYVSATKWLEQIELTTWEDFDGYWVPRGWSKLGPIKIASRIDVPRRADSLVAGEQAVAGVAWAPVTGIGAVEVQVDGGEWQACELGDAASGDTWVQWRLRWDATPGDHELRVRAIAADGAVQIEEPSAPAPDGATGYHARRVTVA